MKRRYGMRLLLLCVATVVVLVLSLGVGRFPISPRQILHALANAALQRPSDSAPNVETVLFLVRIPRIVAGILVGTSLSLSGLVYQTVLRNPIVSPSLLGVSAGAGFGAAIAIMAHWPWAAVQAAAFTGGVVTVALALGVHRALGGRSVVTLVLCGLVMAALFEALISLVKYFADPLDVLPTLTFWLLGTLGKATSADVELATGPILICVLGLYFLRRPTQVLAVGEAEAASLGVSVSRVRLSVIALATLMVALSVALAGIVGWVGLIVPHMARMLFGLAPGRLYPACVLLGALFVVLVDDVARAALIGPELPLGTLTALIGAPVFLILLARVRRTGWQ